MQIERFKMKFGHLVDDVDGNYVKYEDHERVVGEMLNRLDKLLDRYKELQDEHEANMSQF